MEDLKPVPAREMLHQAHIELPTMSVQQGCQKCNGSGIWLEDNNARTPSGWTLTARVCPCIKWIWPTASSKEVNRGY